MRKYLTCGFLAVLSFVFSAGTAVAADRPNILWITCEDISPDLGCYGVDYADTPTLDKLAGDGVRYSHAFATSGVCAPARSCLITGVYPSSLGSHHMRCQGEWPPSLRMFPAYLRQSGYYCTNNSKQDYNLPTPKGTWDESSGKAHYKNRKPGQPFFAVFNYTMTHESRMFGRHKTEHDPAKAPIPPYHPDHPLVREDWGRYHDQITVLDGVVKRLLEELDEQGLAKDTIVFFYGDHGAGLPRSKRWLYDSGLRVPLLVYFPKKYQHLAPAEPGSTVDRLVSFVDFGPTVLSLAGVEVPEHMHGKPFLGGQQAEPREYVYGIRGRIDERYDMVRAVRDRRYKYIRNYMPHKTYALHVGYMYRMETMQVWQRLHDQGKLNPVQDRFFSPTRPVEELYDTVNDPHEIRNLADSPEHQKTLERLRAEHLAWMRQTLDVGLLPEPEIKARPHREGCGNAWDWARSGKYPQQQILEAAMLVGTGPDALPKLVENLADADPAVRFWAALGLKALGEQAEPASDALLKALGDDAPSVAAEAAEALAKLGRADAGLAVLARQLDSGNEYVALRAANALDHLDETARPVLKQMQDCRAGGYPRRVLEAVIGELKQ